MNTRFLTISTLGVLAMASAALAFDHVLRSGPTAKTSRDFAIHSIESAPQPSKEVLQWALKQFGLVPHVLGVMAESPALAQAYQATQRSLQEHGALTPPENNIVQLTIAMENECQYCVAAHTMAGKKFFGSSEAELAALRSKSGMPVKKFDALRSFTVEVYKNKGHVSDEQLGKFLAAGYSRAHALDVVANVAAKVMTNFTNQIAMTPIDEPFRPFAEDLPFYKKRASKSSN